MKHGDKAKAKSAKASSKTSGKKSSKAAGEKSSKAVKTGSKDISIKAGAEKAAAEKASPKAGSGKSAAVTKSGGGTKQLYHRRVHPGLIGHGHLSVGLDAAGEYHHQQLQSRDYPPVKP